MPSKLRFLTLLAILPFSGFVCPNYGADTTVDPPSLQLESYDTNVPSYTQPEKPPRDQQTKKFATIDCPGAEILAEAEGGKTVNFVKLKDGNCYWAAQFRVGKPDKCDAWHLHGGQAIAINGNVAVAHF